MSWQERIIVDPIRMTSSAKVTQVVLTALASRNDWTGNFSIVEEYPIRMQP
jgi:hypothetical protein